jgi:protein SCO1/2
MYMKKRHLAIIIILELIVLAGIVYLITANDDALSPAASNKAETIIQSKFNLVDMHGNRVTEKNFFGKYMLVYFGFTYCPDICPMALHNIHEALNLLSPKLHKKLTAVLITVDPERDDVAQLKSYLSNFQAEIIGLTGTDEEIAEAASAFKVYYAKTEGSKDGDYLVNHSSFIYLMDTHGKYITHFSHQTPAQELANKLKELIH